VLNEPEIPQPAILSLLRNYGLKSAEAKFLPSGDANSVVYYVDASGFRYFLKLRCGDFDEIAATVPAYLHSQGIIRVMAPIPATTGQPSIHTHGFDWMLYPFFEGKTGFEHPLSRANWIILGETEIDPIAIAFFRYERIVVDIAEYGSRIFNLKTSAGDRLSNLRKLATAFLRENVIDTAHKYYLSLT
jgi:hypothetical protein